MKKITTMLNSPAKIAGFAACIIILVAAILFATVQAGANINENKTIGMDKGVNIALDDAGIKLAAAADLTSHYDTEDGNAVYEVSFTAGGYDYDYVIKASNGKILEADREAAKNAAPTGSEKEYSEGKDSDSASNTSNKSNASAITASEAKNIALKHAGISENKATFVKAEKDYEDGVLVYEVEFYSGNTEYDYEIDANTGAVRSFDKDIENYSIPSDKNGGTSSSSSAQPSSDYIGVDKAKSIALKDAGLSSSSVTFTKAKLDRDDGIRVYEIEFFTSSKEYEYEINATTGKIIDKDIDVNDDFDDDDDDEWDD